MATDTTAAQGGAWLLGDTDPAGVFTPEQLTEEHRLIGATTREFIDQEVLPKLDEMERKDWDAARALLRRCGELGLLGANVAEKYGGVDLDKVSSLIVSEEIARVASFGATFGAQANLCILPIYLFGTGEQKAKYLPGLVSGERTGAYALSESGSGSDALAASARAVAQPDGSWVLSGEKMWITNGGFADVIVVFAQADGGRFSAFIVEREFGGVSSGKEEHKMGLTGSSTTPIVLENVPVPAGNLLGELGKGHRVALNTLNFGRFKLGAMCTGGCKGAIGEAARYAAERRQFGHAIATFGAIRHKLGEMTARTYALESVTYRIAGLIDRAVAATGGADGGHDPKAVAEALGELAAEASIAKVFGSEVLDFVLDENVQIHGGNGYVRDYPAERHYRDARVNRIFEGTNEINRLLIPGMLVRRAVKGDLPLIPAAKRLQDEILLPPALADATAAAPLDDELRSVAAFKKVVLLVVGTAMQTYGEKLADEQEVLSACADLLIETYAAESATLRARAARAASRSHADLHVGAARVFVAGAALRIEMAAREALAAMVEGDTLRTLLAALRRLLRATPVNTVALRRELADAVVAEGRYSFH
ncbi:MAG: acyl-CoA dehydrogenase [Acidimicrobiia bacterium]|nr:acyl-CoA dehydrogenase [Acidimicrobiia bacterium]